MMAGRRLTSAAVGAALALVVGGIPLAAYLHFLHTGSALPAAAADRVVRSPQGCITWWLSDAARRSCLSREFAQLVVDQGPRRTLPRIERFAAGEPSIGGGLCHQLMHRSGDEYARHHHLTPQTVPHAQAVGTISRPCGDGFYHGLVETVFRDFAPGDPVRPLASYCEALLTSNARKQCAHALGHRFYRAADGNLARAQALCAQLGARSDGACAPAVFHEFWFVLDRLESDRDLPARLVKEAERVDTAAMCSDLALPRYRIACWVRLLQARGGAQPPASAGAISRMCRLLPRKPGSSEHRNACLAGASAQVALRTRLDRDLSGHQVNLCSGLEDPPETMACLRGVDVRYAQPDLPRRCERLAPSIRADCARWLAHHLSLIRSELVTLVVEACHAMAEHRVRAACLQGTGNEASIPVL